MRFCAFLLFWIPLVAQARWEGPFSLGDGLRNEVLVPAPGLISLTFAPGIEPSWDGQPGSTPDRLQVGPWLLAHDGPLAPPRYHTEGYRLVAGPRDRLDDLLTLLEASVPGVQFAAPRFQVQGTVAVRTVLPQILFQLRSPADSDAVDELLTDLGLPSGQPFGSAPGQRRVELHGHLGSDPLTLADTLGNSPFIRWAQVDWVVPKAARYTPGDSFFASQWHLDNQGQAGGVSDEDIDAPEAWDLTLGEPSAIIAVLDSGVDLDHPDLSEQILPGWDVLDGDAIAEPDGLGSHGTSVAGVAAAPAQGLGVVGVCPRCRILPVRMLGAPDSGEAEAIDFAVDAGAWVINNSWGPIDGTGAWAPMPAVVQTAVENAVTNGRNGLGVAIFWASGNGSPVDSCSDDGYASHESVLAVGATTNLGQHASYSEECAELDLVAPSAGGTASLTTTRIGDYTSTFGGTSGASPVAAGAGGLLLSAFPEFPLDHLVEILESTAEKIDPGDADYDVIGHSDRYGFGRINVLDALRGDFAWIQLGAAVSPCDAEVVVTVTAGDFAGAGTLTLLANSTVETTPEFVTTTEQSAGVFTGIILFGSGPVVDSDGVVSVADGAIGTVRSDDLESERPLTFDCAGAELSLAVVDEVTEDSARVLWTSSERTQGWVRWATGEAADPIVGTEHAVYTTGLEACTEVTIDLFGIDRVGNESSRLTAATFRTGGDPAILPEDAPPDADPCDPGTWIPDPGDDDSEASETPPPPPQLSGGGRGCTCETGIGSPSVPSALLPWGLLLISLRRARSSPCSPPSEAR